MTAAVADLIISCGETLDAAAKSWTWKIDTTPVDLTGYTAELEIRKTSASTARAIWNSTNGKLVIEPLLGRISPNVTAAETLALWESNLVATDEGPFGLGTYSLELTSSTGRVQRLLVGRLLLSSKYYVITP